MDPVKQIKTMLFRRFCPTQMELGEHVLGLSDASQSERITSHVQACPCCQQDLAQIRRFVALPQAREETSKDLGPAAPTLAERVKIFVVNLLSPPSDIFPSFALQPASRGKEDEMRTQAYQIGEYVIALSFQKDSQQPDRYDLLGDILSADESDLDFRQWRAELWQAEKLLSSVPLDEDGSFTFTGVQIGDVPHELIVSGAEVEIHLQNLQVP